LLLLLHLQLMMLLLLLMMLLLFSISLGGGRAKHRIHVCPSGHAKPRQVGLLNQRSFSVRQLLSGRIRLQQPRRQRHLATAAATSTGAAAWLPGLDASWLAVFP